MKKTKLISLLIAIAVFGLALLNPFENKDNQITEEDLIPVVVARENIDVQTMITEELVYVKKIYKDAVPEEAIRDMESVLGKVSKVAIMAEDLLMPGKIYEIGASVGGLGYIVEEGQRALSVDIGYSTGVSGLLKIGNRVDLIGVVAPLTGEGEIDPKDLKARVLQENLKIIALDRHISAGSLENAEEGYATVVFQVSPEQALEMSVALPNVQGLRLALRNQNDEKATRPEEVKIDKVIR